MHSVELFAGCGGLALGVSEAGFKHMLVVERDHSACSTLSANQLQGVRHVSDWPLKECDVIGLDYSNLTERIDLLSGGPPCQPFSIGGAHLGPLDERNMWPEAIRAVREIKPKTFLFENVRGLLRPAFARYLEYLRLQLARPDITPKAPFDWEAHLIRLSKAGKSASEPTYRVAIGDINAADYGAAQKRHRVIIMGVRSDITSQLTLPTPSHSREALIWSQEVSGDYWDHHRISRRLRPPITQATRALVDRLRAEGRPIEKPWVTVRDAIYDLPPPRINQEPLPNHRLHPGARSYPHHTGSTWDEPAKALKAGAHGVPGGENMLVLKNGRVRYFSIREMARLQGFPDNFVVTGGWVHSIKQLGNAVPVPVGLTFAKALREVIIKSEFRSTSEAVAL
ncbi:MAG TPA: DNA cytosine methyltransferase [Myxococcaceae bacterium]|nr:DNA cytosine methyltransferase [Myxococcaceae bacterium]